MTVLIRPHAKAIRTLLATATMPDGAPLRIGYGIAPKSTDGKLVVPCAVFHLRPGGQLSGSLGAINTDVDLPFSVISIGRSQEEAEGVADRVALTLEGAAITVTDRSVVRIGRPSGGAPITGANRDPQVPDLFYVPVEYRLWTVPA